MGHLPVGARVTLNVDPCAQKTKEQRVRAQVCGLWFLGRHRAYRRPSVEQEAIVRHNLQHRSNPLEQTERGLSRFGRGRPHQQPYNNALHQTGRGGVAFRSSRPVIEARPAGERGCSTGLGKIGDLRR